MGWSQAITHQLYDTTVVFCDCRLHQFLAEGFEASRVDRFIHTQKAVETGDIGGKNGGKPTRHAQTPSHNSLTILRGRIHLSINGMSHSG
jgi:hypothetical protein